MKRLYVSAAEAIESCLEINRPHPVPCRKEVNQSHSPNPLQGKKRSIALTQSLAGEEINQSPSPRPLPGRSEGE
ncbi:MAG TPA: hypothetical protein VK179_13955 [Bacteroidales bacterium]|nr:hypothetical protein [Bacteroidales bacterium]